MDWLKREGYADDRVAAAMLANPRENFVSGYPTDTVYQDTPLPIPLGQVITQPSLVAEMTRQLGVRPGARVLEIGTGSGWQAGILCSLVGRRGLVVTIERHRALQEEAKRKLTTSGQRNFIAVVGDGSGGYPALAPYDRIVVTAGAPGVPRPLLDQLKPGGRMLIPIGDRANQTLMLVEKGESGKIATTSLLPVLFVPLIGEHGWREE